jgi:hypothetical protein
MASLLLAEFLFPTKEAPLELEVVAITDVKHLPSHEWIEASESVIEFEQATIFLLC